MLKYAFLSKTYTVYSLLCCITINQQVSTSPPLWERERKKKGSCWRFYISMAPPPFPSVTNITFVQELFENSIILNKSIPVLWYSWVHSTFQIWCPTGKNVYWLTACQWHNNATTVYKYNALALFCFICTRAFRSNSLSVCGYNYVPFMNEFHYTFYIHFHFLKCPSLLDTWEFFSMFVQQFFSL